MSGRGAGHRGRARREVPVGRGRIGEVRLEHDDPTAALECLDPGRRAGRRPGGRGERWRCRRPRAIARGGPSPPAGPGPVRRPRRRGVAGGRRRGPGDRHGPAPSMTAVAPAAASSRRTLAMRRIVRPTAVRTAASDASDPGAPVTAASAAASADSAHVGGERDCAVGDGRAVQVEPRGPGRCGVPRRDRLGQSRHPLDGLAAARDRAWRIDVQHRAPDDRIGTARAAKHEPVARCDRDRLGQPQDRRGRPVGQVDGVAPAAPDRGVDRGRAQMDARPRPVGQGTRQPDEQARTGRDARVRRQHDPAMQ